LASMGGSEAREALPDGALVLLRHLSSVITMRPLASSLGD
jgi:hypothetical protein